MLVLSVTGASAAGVRGQVYDDGGQSGDGDRGAVLSTATTSAAAHVRLCRHRSHGKTLTTPQLTPSNWKRVQLYRHASVSPIPNPNPNSTFDPVFNACLGPATSTDFWC